MTFNIYNRNNCFSRLRSVSALLWIISFLAGCVKSDELRSLDEGTIYMPQAFQDKATMTLYKMDAPQAVVFGAYYGGFNAPGNDVTVKFEIDPPLIDYYNTLNAYLGYSYHLLPDSVYSLSGTSTVIKAGKKTSEPLTINVEGKKIQFGYKYMLPIRIVSVSDGKQDSALSIAFFKLDSLLTRTNDLTAQATLTVSDENRNGAGSGEGSPKLIDGSVDTKFLSFNYNPNFWMQLSFTEGKYIDAYDMTSADDASERDPRTWELVGSNDGTNWTNLDRRENEEFPDRKYTRRFNVSTPGSYRFYRLRVLQNGGAGIFQQAEWRLLQFY